MSEVEIGQIWEATGYFNHLPKNQQVRVIGIATLSDGQRLIEVETLDEHLIANYHEHWFVENEAFTLVSNPSFGPYEIQKSIKADSVVSLEQVLVNHGENLDRIYSVIQILEEKVQTLEREMNSVQEFTRPIG